MTKYKFIREGTEENFRKRAEVIGKIRDDKFEDIIRKIIEHKKFFQVYINSGAIKTVASQIRKIARMNKDDSISLIEAVAIFGQIDKQNYLEDLTSDLEMIGIKAALIDKVVRIVTICREMKISSKIKEKMEIKKLSMASLPSLSGCTSSFDVRYEFKNNKIIRKIPVAIIRISTVEPNEEEETKTLTLQTRRDILKLFIKDLREVYKRLELLEKEVN